MVTARNDKAAEKLAIAEQVIVSAGNILIAAGFDRSEIQSFFRQAADQLEPAASAENSAEVTSTPEGPLHTAFREIPAVRKLAVLGQRAAALEPLETPGGALRDHFDIAMQMVPLIAEAQDWLRRAAMSAGLELAADRMAGGNSAQAFGDTLFLDDFGHGLDGAFRQIIMVCENLVDLGDEEALAFTLSALAENGIIVTRDLAAMLQSGTALLAERRSGG